MNRETQLSKLADDILEAVNWLNGPTLYWHDASEPESREGLAKFLRMRASEARAIAVRCISNTSAEKAKVHLVHICHTLSRLADQAELTFPLVDDNGAELGGSIPFIPEWSDLAIHTMRGYSELDPEVRELESIAKLVRAEAFSDTTKPRGRKRDPKIDRNRDKKIAEAMKSSGNRAMVAREFGISVEDVERAQDRHRPHKRE